MFLPYDIENAPRIKTLGHKGLILINICSEALAMTERGTTYQLRRREGANAHGW